LPITMPATSSPAAERPALTRDVAKFLAELAVSLNNYGIYPEDHPRLQSAAESVRARLATLLEDRPLFSLGVANRQLVVEGRATDPGNPVLGGLAQRLHRRRIGGITIEQGVSDREFADLLRSVANEELDLFDERTAPTWDHASVHPINYSRLQLSDDPDLEQEPEIRGTSTASRLWLRLASTALGQLDEDAAADADPSTLARAIERANAERGQVVSECLLKLASELKHTDDEEDREVSERISNLVVSLEPDTLERLISLSGAKSRRRQMVLDASQAFAADAVVEIVRAASATDEQPISKSLLRLFSKLAIHSRSPNRRVSGTASTSLRAQVASLVDGWRLADPNPDAYSDLLDTMTRERTHSGTQIEESVLPEPLRIIQMSLELDDASPRLAAALDSLAEQSSLTAILPLLDALPPAHRAAQVVWDRLATPENLLLLIGRGAAGTAALDPMLARMGDDAIEPLLQILAESEVRTVRRTTLNCLVRCGEAVLPAVVARLEAEAPWYVHRNLLSLLHEVAAVPAGTLCTRFLHHADACVRREAVKLLLTSEEWRSRALCTAFADSDPQVLQLALADVQRGCPPKAAEPLLAFVADRGHPAEQRVLAIRGLRTAHTPEALDALLQLAGPQRNWLGRDRLPPKSPETMAALGVLVAQWADDPRVRTLIRLIEKARDPELGALLTTPN
jgi:hypothetical protein